jgi:hypothetical protein
MTKYIIPVTSCISYSITIEANSPEEALDIARNSELTEASIDRRDLIDISIETYPTEEICDVTTLEEYEKRSTISSIKVDIDKLPAELRKLVK